VVQTKSLIAPLTRQAVEVSRSVAAFLHTVEGDPKLRGADPLLLTPRDLVAAVPDTWRHGEDGLRAALRRADVLPSIAEVAPDEEPGSRDPVAALELRLAGLVLQAWVEHGGRRPDVLAVTCDLLANPDVPHTHEIVRFAIVLILRALYDIRYDLGSLGALRDAYMELKARFANKARRHRRTASNHDTFLIDLLCLEGWAYRSSSDAAAAAHYRSFSMHTLGVERAARDFGRGPWPPLYGKLPELATLLNVAFNQPSGVLGFDEVTDGLMPTWSEPGAKRSSLGGLATLVAGPAGSGKTSLCLSITSRMAELGSVVRYVATEEGPSSLNAKRTALVEPLATALWPDVPFSVAPGNWDVIDGQRFRSLEELVAQLERDFTASSDESAPAEEESMARPLHLVFPAVVVIDSLPALIHEERVPSPEEPPYEPEITAVSRRRQLAMMLTKLRSLGVCVFLVGGLADVADEGLDHLVDNVFVLDTDKEISPRHPLRTFTVQKTRVHASHRGSHAFHLSRRDGCTVSPSLHSVLRSVRARAARASDAHHYAVIWSPGTKHEPTQQMLLRDEGGRRIDERRAPILVRDRAQILVYGRGSAGKARFALALALDPRVSRTHLEEWEAYVHPSSESASASVEKPWIERSRVLVISFLYGRDYYEGIVGNLLQSRYRLAHAAPAKHTTILDFYPGYIDPETLIARIREELRRGALEGRPYTAAVVDGVHNLLLQFPLLEKEPLLWPTLFQVFLVAGVSAITTFTFFKVERLSSASRGQPPEVDETMIDRSRAALAGTDHLFFQLLVSKCDYTFLVERPSVYPGGVPRACVRVRVASSIDAQGNEPDEFWWDPTTGTYR
jgi:KaiC/GvpD/RAD55 family RecA-like ATPase